MKRSIVISLMALVIALFSASLFAADDEATLKIKAELYQERLARIEAQSVILQEQHKQARSDFQAAQEQLKAIEEKKKEQEKKDSKKDKPKTDAPAKTP